MKLRITRDNIRFRLNHFDKIMLKRDKYIQEHILIGYKKYHTFYFTLKINIKFNIMFNENNIYVTIPHHMIKNLYTYDFYSIKKKIKFIKQRFLIIIENDFIK